VPDQQLDKADYDSVYAAMAELEQQGWRKATLNERVAAWEALVDEVEQGYDMTVYDYTNDLAVREWLDRARPLVTARVQASLDARLAPLDARFRTATFLAATRLPGAGDAWFFRLPRVLVGELAEDAARMNLVPANQE
jgi:hypothetical protein